MQYMCWILYKKKKKNAIENIIGIIEKLDMWAEY